ncbi:MAG TPA: hypothetical protein VMT95_11755 [Candidatus Binatia bacterium]|nr:hypothetical protein [Candidatus Binatia bacterium]
MDTLLQAQTRRITLLVNGNNVRRLLKLVKFDLLFEIQRLF